MRVRATGPLDWLLFAGIVTGAVCAIGLPLYGLWLGVTALLRGVAA